MFFLKKYKILFSYYNFGSQNLLLSSLKYSVFKTLVLNLQISNLICHSENSILLFLEFFTWHRIMFFAILNVDHKSFLLLDCKIIKNLLQTLKNCFQKWPILNLPARKFAKFVS